MPDGFLIGEGFLNRIRRAVDGAEKSPYRMHSPEIPVRLEGEGDGGGGGIRLGEITGSWLKGTTKTVIRLNGNGTPVTPEQTFTAKNWFADISIDCGTRKVCCVSVGGTWVLVSAEC